MANKTELRDDVILAYFRDGALPLIEKGYFIFWEEAEIEVKLPSGNKVKIKVVRPNVAAPPGTELSISGKGEIILDGKVIP